MVSACHQATTWSSQPLTVTCCTWFRGGDAVGLSPNIRIYRYKPKQFFDAHCRSNWPKHDSHFLSLLLKHAARLSGCGAQIASSSVFAIFNEPG